MNELQA